MKGNFVLFLLFLFSSDFLSKDPKLFGCRSYLLLVTGYECIVPENCQSSSPTSPFKPAFAVHTQAFMFLFLKYLLANTLLLFECSSIVVSLLTFFYDCFSGGFCRLCFCCFSAGWQHILSELHTSA